MFDTTTLTLSSALATSGTVSFSYPQGRTRGDYLLGFAHKMVGTSATYLAPVDFTLSFSSASSITLTWNGTQTLPAGSTYTLELDRLGSEGIPGLHSQSIVSMMQAAGSPNISVIQGITPKPMTTALGGLVYVSFGTPATASTTAIANAVNVATSGAAPGTTLTLNGTLALTVAGTLRAVLDVPRNVTVTSASDASSYTVRVTGLDMYGRAMSEDITGPNNTTTVGLKAFYVVTGASIYGSGDPPAVSIGFGTVLGIPFVLSSVGLVLREFLNGVTASNAGTFVVQATAQPTRTTGDVRGTYAPHSSNLPDGTRGFGALIAAFPTDVILPQA